MSREVTEYCLTCLDSTGEYIKPTNYQAIRDESLEWVWEWRDEHVEQHEGSTQFLTVERGEQKELAGPLGGYAAGDVVTIDAEFYPSAKDREFRITGFAALGDQGFIAHLDGDDDDTRSAYLDHITKVGSGSGEELFDFTIKVQVLASNEDEATKFLEEETKVWQGTAFGYPSMPLDKAPPFVNDFEITSANETALTRS